ncbi:mechanosensitive ion channel family protein [Thiomicrorhabdus xiamenensis]|uniref:Small-conductance mechanosensitive channel n=1 Tax=Thiomicrorhabdus xiamenensis TaxID=2739063 RepID=A0A7D4NN30_9GAMM|nr:mechanosensitive ion channel domain-containing protein [Thiomicrorhabdus xiamenensis]QKI88393.1 mechanosensitive ion channel [Thiomicrorhabdus xiamenensis]
MNFDFDLNHLVNDVAIPWGTNIALAIAIFLLGRIVISFVLSLLERVFKRSSKVDAMLSEFILSLSKAFMLLVLVIAVLSQLGVDTTSLVALVGAAGLAVGLALKDSLQNFASGVMLLVLKPFKTGDFVEAGGVMGVVEKIHIFNTVMRTGDNKEIIIPNGSIYSDSITNYSARDTRRVDMVFGISYDDDIKLAKEILQRLISEDERVLPEPEPVIALGELGASSIDFIVRPWVNSADYWKVKWEMNEKVKMAFDEAGISIPYPQMDVHLFSETKE